MNRLRRGWCTVPNPFNPLQVSEVSLRPEDVDVLVFWTRNPLPLLPHLEELEQNGYRFYFLVTLMDNPREMDPQCPPRTAALRAFQALADRIGPDRVIWRYDPMVLSNVTNLDFHGRAFGQIAGRLQGYTKRCIVSMMHPYRKVKSRLAGKGIVLKTWEEKDLENFMPSLAEEARERGMEILSCASPVDLERYGIHRGKCVDDDYIRRVFGIEVTQKKDPSQRQACGCVVSKDIGMYDTCLFGCLYCYATNSFERAHANHRRHDSEGPSLVPLP